MTEQEGAHLFNIHEFSAQDGPLFVEFYAGDILAKYSDALIISSFIDSYLPTPGSVFGSINERFGLRFSSTRPPGTESYSDRLHRFPARRTDAFRDLWVLEMRSVESSTDQPSLGELRASLSLLERHLDSICESEVHSISVPLLGTGFQGVVPELVVGEMLGAIERWPQRASELKVVRVFARDLEKVAALNMAIDRQYGRPSPGVSQLLRAALEELKALVDRLQQAEVKEALNDLYQVADVSEPSVKSIAIEGRKVAETCALGLLRVYYPNQSAGELWQCLNAIQDDLLKNRAWVFSYLKLLQTYGNKAAHPGQFKTTVADAAAIVVSATRVGSFVEEVER